MASNNQKESVLDVVVKEIIDPSYFWAQIGTESHFEVFKKDMREMSEWCESCPNGRHQDSSSVYVDLIVAIKDERSGDNANWVRGKIARIISESTVEVFLVDVGRVAIASVSQICAGFPPVLMKIPQQALHCVLAGVEQMMCSEEVESESSWSEEAVKVFKSLVVANPTKAIVRKVVDGKQIFLSIFTPFEGKYTSVGEILGRKKLVKGRFQIYFVVYDAYRINNTPSVGAFAVDRFAINVTLDGIPSSLPRETYHGIYGIAQLDLSFEIQSDNYFILPTTSSPITTPDANSATSDSPPDISSSLNIPPDLSSTGTTASGSEEEVPTGDNCVAFMNSYRILQILVITLPIVAVIVTVVVMTVFIYLIHCCRKYYSTKIQNHTFQITELSVKENPSNPNFPLKTEILHHDCDINPTYDTVKSTTNVSYGVVKSTIIDGGNNEKNGTDNYYYT